MSVTIEDKIEVFSKMIFGNIEEQSSEKRQRLAETHQKQLEALKFEVEKRKNELMENALGKAERERTKLTAQAKNQQQQMLVNQKQQAMHGVMKKLQEMATAFTDTEAYKAYMEKNIQSVIETLNKSKQIVFYVMEKDLQLCRQIVAEQLKNANRQVDFKIEKASNNIIGGIVAEDVAELLQFDLTIKALIDENKEAVGAAITRRYNEVSSL